MTHLELSLEAHSTWLPPYFSDTVQFTFSSRLHSVTYIQDCAKKSELGGTKMKIHGMF